MRLKDCYNTGDFRELARRKMPGIDDARPLRRDRLGACVALQQRAKCQASQAES